MFLNSCFQVIYSCVDLFICSWICFFLSHFFNFPSVYLSMTVSACLSLNRLVCPFSIRWCFYFSIDLPTYLSIHLAIYFSFRLFNVSNLYVCQFVYLSQSISIFGSLFHHIRAHDFCVFCSILLHLICRRTMCFELSLVKIEGVRCCSVLLPQVKKRALCCGFSSSVGWRVASGVLLRNQWRNTIWPSTAHLSSRSDVRRVCTRWQGCCCRGNITLNSVCGVQGKGRAKHLQSFHFQSSKFFHVVGVWRCKRPAYMA